MISITLLTTFYSFYANVLVEEVLYSQLIHLLLVNLVLLLGRSVSLVSIDINDGPIDQE